MLVEQKDGYSTNGLYHTGIRDELVSAFQVQHMAWRVDADPHPRVNYTLSEGDLFRQLCRMDPIYSRRPSKGDVVFRSGDVRSTVDDQLMEKASDVKETALEVLEALQERVKELSESDNPATKRGIDERDASLLPRSWCG